MLKKLRLLCCLTLALVAAGCCTPDASKELSVTLRPQLTSQWCWAASTQMSMEFLGSNVSQCTQANKRLGRTDCCNNPTPNACVQPGYPEYAKYSFTADNTTAAALSWDVIKEQISCRSRPVTFSWKWDGGGGHRMVIAGYQTTNGVNMVRRFNPLPVPSGNNAGGTIDYIPYDEYVSAPGHMNHGNDFYNITKQ